MPSPKPAPFQPGDLIRVFQPGGAYDGYTGRVMEPPDELGFWLSDGRSTLSCPQGWLLRIIEKRNRRYGCPHYSTAYQKINEHAN